MTRMTLFGSGFTVTVPSGLTASRFVFSCHQDIMRPESRRLDLVNASPLIGPYDAPGAQKVVDLRPWDARGPAAANTVMRLLQTALPGIAIEHVGSTSVPGCEGKGILDLMLLIPAGHLSEACAIIDGMGFQPQSGCLFPPD